jgi:hypothetical protein
VLPRRRQHRDVLPPHSAVPGIFSAKMFCTVSYSAGHLVLKQPVPHMQNKMKFRFRSNNFFKWMQLAIKKKISDKSNQLNFFLILFVVAARLQRPFPAIVSEKCHFCIVTLSSLLL